MATDVHKCVLKSKLGGGQIFFMFTPISGEVIQFDKYF